MTQVKEDSDGERRNAAPLRRAADGDRRAPAAQDSSGAAEYLLERRALLDRSLQPLDGSAPANIARRTPDPAALLVLESPTLLERFVKLLSTANIEVDQPATTSEALASLERRVHAVMFTDRAEVIRSARQLDTGSSTHIVFVDPQGGAGMAEALRSGANDCMTVETRGEQFWAHLSTARRIVDLAASLQLALTDNRILSTIDELTRCGSRRFFEHQFPREAERAARLGRTLSLALCDIDHFKSINDRYGHQAGDEVLREFAQRLTGGLRMHDDWVARVGGEEFAVVLPEAAESETRMIAQRLCDRVSAATFETTAGVIAVTASFGVCSLAPLRGNCRGMAEAMVKSADAALYESKRTGRNRVTAGNPQLHTV